LWAKPSNGGAEGSAKPQLIDAGFLSLVSERRESEKRTMVNL
jgi:hypothetical protein